MRKLVFHNAKKYRALREGVQISSINQYFFSPTTITLNDGATYPSTCINCVSPKCIHYSQTELYEDSEIFAQFPINNSPNVCPTNAIYVKSGTNFPEIDSSKCIGCGLCVKRCPVGAIYIDQNTTKACLINNEVEIYSYTNDASGISYNNTLEYFNAKEYNFDISHINDTYVFNIMSLIEDACRQQSHLENLIIRNILVNIGLPCKIRQAGISSIRMDLFFESNQYICIGEIDFGQDWLENYRSLLDDIAVIHSRYDIDANDILPVFFCLKFINKRSNVYELVTDIKSVLDIQIHTISLLSLYLFYWLQYPLELPQVIEKFIVDKNKVEIASDVAELLDISSTIDLFETEFLQAIK